MKKKLLKIIEKQIKNLKQVKQSRVSLSENTDNIKAVIDDSLSENKLQRISNIVPYAKYLCGLPLFSCTRGDILVGNIKQIEMFKNQKKELLFDDVLKYDKEDVCFVISVKTETEIYIPDGIIDFINDYSGVSLVMMIRDICNSKIRITSKSSLEESFKGVVIIAENCNNISVEFLSSAMSQKNNEYGTRLNIYASNCTDFAIDSSKHSHCLGDIIVCDKSQIHVSAKTMKCMRICVESDSLLELPYYTKVDGLSKGADDCESFLFRDFDTSCLSFSGLTLNSKNRLRISPKIKSNLSFSEIESVASRVADDDVGIPAASSK